MDFLKTFKSPFNIDLIRISKDDIDNLSLKEIKETLIFDNKKNFHPEGLFSTEIFGLVGSEERSSRFAYIDLHNEFLHPIIYYIICKISSFYRSVMEGKSRCVFDEKNKVLLPSKDYDSNTGFSFFIRVVDNLDLRKLRELKGYKENTEQAEFMLKLFELAKSKNLLKMRYLLVIPAGVRDYTIRDKKPQEDEINSIYRKILYHVNLIKNTSTKDKAAYDNTLFSTQELLLDVFNLLKSYLEGKHKLILGKWLTRKIFNSTRNVLSSNVEKTKVYSPKLLRYNECNVGLHQFTRSIVPKCFYEITKKISDQTFFPSVNLSILTNRNTLKKEEVPLHSIEKEYKLWSTNEGLMEVISSFGSINLRDIPVTIGKNNHYMGLIYQDDKYFKFFKDIDDLPEYLDRKYVRPITLTEVLYISLYHLNGKIPALVTRYPITGYGSIYPCYMKIRTTTEDLTLEELDDNWQPSGNIAYNYPIVGTSHFNTMAIHQSHFAAAGADVDGDTMSLIAVLSDEAEQEIRNLLNRKEYYISSTGKFFFSMNTDVVEAVVNYLTS